MNFLKNTFNKLVGKTEQQPKKEQPQPKNEQTVESNIPEDALTDLFQMCAQCVAESKMITDNQSRLLLYSFYKQATIGDCNVDKPNMMDFVGVAKWKQWNRHKGMTKATAIHRYIGLAVKSDPNIQKKMAASFQNQQYEEDQSAPPIQNQEGVVMKMVEQQDFSQKYEHPYFKPIQKGDDITEISHDLLLKKNNSPAVFPLHFAIEKEREDLVPKFLQLLSAQEIETMKDEEGTGILEYAELMQNEAILNQIKQKLEK